jgi:hypothetical protein
VTSSAWIPGVHRSGAVGVVPGAVGVATAAITYDIGTSVRPVGRSPIRRHLGGRIYPVRGNVTRDMNVRSRITPAIAGLRSTTTTTAPGENERQQHTQSCPDPTR